MPNAQRITTEYDEHEDRLRLSGNCQTAPACCFGSRNALPHTPLTSHNGSARTMQVRVTLSACGKTLTGNKVLPNRRHKHSWHPAHRYAPSASTASWRVDRAHIIETTTTTGTPTLCVVFQGRTTRGPFGVGPSAFTPVVGHCVCPNPTRAMAHGRLAHLDAQPGLWCPTRCGAAFEASLIDHSGCSPALQPATPTSPAT